MNENERRKFIRHPVNVPISIIPQQEGSLGQMPMSDVGTGGLAFLSPIAFFKGALLKINITFVQPEFEASTIVCWLRHVGDQFEVGVRFLDDDSSFKARMVEQVCHIEEYREQARRNGRTLSSEQAAHEWINEYAADFGM